MGHAQVCEQEIHAPIQGIFSSASVQALQSQPHICSPPPPPFFCQYYLGGRHARRCHCAAVMQKIMFPVGTKLHRSKHEHFLKTGLSFLHLSYLFNLPLCTYLFFFSFFFLFKKRKSLSQSNWLLLLLNLCCFAT